jgi:hypothetical protein
MEYTVLENGVPIARFDAKYNAMIFINARKLYDIDLHGKLNKRFLLVKGDEYEVV